MLNMYETPQANASMMTAKVMRKRRTSFIMWLMLRMMGPKYLEAMPTLMVLRMAREKAAPHKMRPPAASRFRSSSLGFTLGSDEEEGRLSKRE